jgi:pilus assembly protein CpaE
MTVHDRLAPNDRLAPDCEAGSRKPLSIAVIGDSKDRQKQLREMIPAAQAEIADEFRLPPVEDLPRLLEKGFDVLIVDAAENSEAAIRIVEAVCTLQPALTVMVWARAADADLLVRSMHAGAREFLSDPLRPQVLVDACTRIALRRDEIRRQKKVAGRCLVFAGAKGGAGVTTLAVNFAVALAAETGQKVALLDLDPGLGDAALELGLSAELSALDALRNEERLDSEFVSKLLVRHASGVYVLASSDEYTDAAPAPSAVIKLVNILRFDFPWLVIDADSRFGAYGRSLFEAADTVYLVTQVGVPDLRNANRFMRTFAAGADAGKMQVVLNRYELRAGEIDEQSMAKALTVAPSWKVPNDFNTVHLAENSATPLILKNGSITRVLRQMARVACGKSPQEAKKGRFSLFS